MSGMNVEHEAQNDSIKLECSTAEDCSDEADELPEATEVVENSGTIKKRYNLRTRNIDVVPIYGSPDATSDEEDASVDGDELIREGDESTEDRGYKCSECDYQAEKAYMLKRHMTVHTGERPFSCSVCKKTYRTIRALREHKHRHSGEPRHKCDQCDYKCTDRSTMYWHKRKHEGIVIPCTQEGCSYTTLKLSRMKLHLLRHAKQAGEGTPFSCKICGRGFVTRRELRYHHRRHTGLKPFKCQECSYAARTSRMLKKHVQKCHSGRPPKLEVVEEQSMEQQSTEEVKAPMEADPETQVLFEDTTPPTANEPDMEEEWTEMEYIEIGADLRSAVVHPIEAGVKAEAEQPSSSVHIELKKNQCPICLWIASCKKSLTRHMVVHTKERPYVCKECGQAFTQPGSLKTHMAVHSDARPFVCAECGASYKRSYELTMHRRKHTGELLQCPDCDFKTWKNTVMSKHKARFHREHRPFKCSKCPKSFALLQFLRRHEAKHPAGAPKKRLGKMSACDQCDFVSKNMAGLTRHVQQCHAEPFTVVN